MNETEPPTKVSGLNAEGAEVFAQARRVNHEWTRILLMGVRLSASSDGSAVKPSQTQSNPVKPNFSNRDGVVIARQPKTGAGEKTKITKRTQIKKRESDCAAND